MKGYKVFSIRIVFFAAMMAFLLRGAPIALAQGGARVYLQPVGSDGETVTLEVRAENVTEMYGAEFRLSYDPAVIAVHDAKADQEGIQIEPGALLPADQGFVVANEVNEVEGTITFAMTLLNPAPAANGSGPLAHVTFHRLQDNPSTIYIERAKLVSRKLQTIPSETVAFELDNATAPPGNKDAPQSGALPAAANEPLTPNSNELTAPNPVGFPWWIVAAAIIILGTLALGSLIILGGSKAAPGIPDVSSGPQPSKSYADGPTGTRPSAFKQQTFPPDGSQKSRQY